MTHRCATCGRYSRDRKQDALRERVHEDLRAYVEAMRAPDKRQRKFIRQETFQKTGDLIAV